MPSESWAFKGPLIPAKPLFILQTETIQDVKNNEINNMKSFFSIPASSDTNYYALC